MSIEGTSVAILLPIVKPTLGHWELERLEAGQSPCSEDVAELDAERRCAADEAITAMSDYLRTAVETAIDSGVHASAMDPVHG